MSSPFPPGPEQQRQLGQYLLVEKLGQGGMAEVWKARNQFLGTFAAIKFLIPGFAGHAETEQRFLGEGKRQAQLRHSNIVSAFDFLYSEGRSYLVMEYIEGEGLDEKLLKLRAPMPLEAVQAISRDVLAALDYAHAHEVIHRDVKPSNILIENGGRALVMDFGIALAANEQRITRVGMAIGTPEYMSPEQIIGARNIDHRTDIYSFGCVLYEMLTLHAPFEVPQGAGETDYLVKEMHLRQPPLPPRQLNPAIPEHIDIAVMRCLEKQAADRFGSCHELLAEISRTPSKPAYARTVMESAVADASVGIAPPLRPGTSPRVPSATQYEPTLSSATIPSTPVTAQPPQERNISHDSSKPPRSPALWITGALLCAILAAAGAYFFLHQNKEAPPPQEQAKNETPNTIKNPSASPKQRGQTAPPSAPKANGLGGTNADPAPDESNVPKPSDPGPSQPDRTIPASSTPAKELSGTWQGEYNDYAAVQTARVLMHVSAEDATTVRGLLNFDAGHGNSGTCSASGIYSAQRNFVTLNISNCSKNAPAHLQGDFGAQIESPSVRKLMGMEGEGTCTLEIEKR
jgi:eukaryotic-like serine/threonine-protein kinase